ncbi:MAG: ABC transporter ATP-binding protein [Gammaproteobacteria bacterium TMED34]|mgnify:FL=1|nr:MAG: ABC transporter ATP-binding protein [Gammaproteobacteria bacterium TMED34]
MNNVSLSFGGVKAVQNVGFSVKEGEVFSIIGPNGAGKSTLFNLISRLYDCDSGHIFWQGEEITQVPSHRIAEMGIARTFQNTELFEHETVLRNLLIGKHIHRRSNVIMDMLFMPSVRRQELQFRKEVEDVIDLLNLQHYRDQVIANLPYGVRKMVEVARALCIQPKAILLDEPSSGLNPEETEDVSFWIEDINEELGATVIMVEHDMKLVSQVSDRVLALADGQVLAIGTPPEIQQHPEVLRAYLGDEE